MGKGKSQKALLIATLVLCSVLLLCLIGFVAWKQIPADPKPGTTPSATQGDDIPETTETEPTTEPTEPPISLNRFGPEDFQFEGDYLTCNSEWYLLGIDVSKYQGYVD